MDNQLIISFITQADSPTAVMEVNTEVRRPGLPHLVDGHEAEKACGSDVLQGCDYVLADRSVQARGWLIQEQNLAGRGKGGT